MTAGMPFYVSPEQLMKDRADFARKGIARGRSVVVLAYDNGIAFVAENPSRALHKISEIYDRIAFAAVGKYNEFENLAGYRGGPLRRPARLLLRPLRRHGPGPRQRLRPDPRHRLHPGVQAVRGRDRRRRGRHEPRERPCLPPHLRRLRGGRARGLSRWAGSGADRGRARGALARGPELAEALTLAVSLLGTDPAGGPTRDLQPEQLEVAVLDRHRPRRTFRRITGPLPDGS